MKTYTETQDRTPFDWNKALENPPDIGSFNHVHLRSLAANWVTCACGNQCDIIPRGPYGDPFDNQLNNLGNDFYEEIKRGYWDDAKRTLMQIEMRSAILIKELTK